MRLWTVVLEISVLMAQFPSREIAQLSYDYRTLGLGYANIGGLLMSSGLAYDSAAGRAYCGALSAIMTGVCYATSAEMAAERGAFARYADNAEAMLRVVRNHRRAAYGLAKATSSSPSPRCRSTAPPAPTRPCRPRPCGLGQGAGARPGARLPQRPGHRRRPHRHDRPGDGLRHHRHRARFRAGEIQEARGRRLFQDHQPRRSRRSARARLWRGADSPRSRPMPSATPA